MLFWKVEDLWHMSIKQSLIEQPCTPDLKQSKSSFEQ